MPHCTSRDGALLRGCLSVLVRVQDSPEAVLLSLWISSDSRDSELQPFKVLHCSAPHEPTHRCGDTVSAGGGLLQSAAMARLITVPEIANLKILSCVYIDFNPSGDFLSMDSATCR